MRVAASVARALLLSRGIETRGGSEADPGFGSRAYISCFTVFRFEHKDETQRCVFLGKLEFNA